MPPAPDVDAPAQNQHDGEVGRGSGPFHAHVGPAGVIATVTSFVSTAVLIVYVLMKVWPHPTPSGAPTADVPPKDSASVAATTAADSAAVVQQGAAKIDPRSRTSKPGVASGPLWCDPSIYPQTYALTPPDSMRDPECVTLFGRAFPLWAEQRLLLLTLLAGTLGGLIHALRSIGWYVGSRSLIASWLPYYILLPLTGGLIAVAFYLVIRGGFFSPSGSFRDTSPLGFAAMAVLVGMFSTSAALKLKQLAETMFTRSETGPDHAPAAPSTSVPSEASSATMSPGNGERGDLSPANSGPSPSFG